MSRSLHALASFNFWRRFLQLQTGLMIFGLAITLMLRANIGLDPWSVFHQGLSLRLGISFGQTTQLVGLALIGLSYLLLRVKPGVATLLNMLLVGPWVDFFSSRNFLPTAEGYAAGIVQFTVGVTLIGLASGLYIAARFGAGPRDSFILGLVAKFGQSVRLTRAGLELCVLSAGYLLGGLPGLGTVIFALSVGFFMQLFLKLFGYTLPVKPLPAQPVAQAAD